MDGMKKPRCLADTELDIGRDKQGSTAASNMPFGGLLDSDISSERDVRWASVIRLRSAVLSGCYEIRSVRLADRLIGSILSDYELADQTREHETSL